MVAILDYDAGNIKSVEKAFNLLGQETILTRDYNEIMASDRLVLPGVGSFKDAMDHLNEYDLIKAIRDFCDSGKPFLGICLGLQLLFEGSEESPGVEGLGLLKGQIKRFPDDMGLKIPHIGWNSLEITPDARLFKGIDNESFVYFVHSYYLQAEDTSIVAAKCHYGIDFHASIEKDNIFACQFHPEKSSSLGLEILKNFSEL